MENQQNSKLTIDLTSACTTVGLMFVWHLRHLNFAMKQELGIY